MNLTKVTLKARHKSIYCMIPFIQNGNNSCMLIEVRTVAILDGREKADNWKGA